MHRFLRQMLDQIRIKNAKRRKRHLAVLVLSLFVASGVLWQLKITGITMTGEALCGYLEHQHSEQCVEKALSCGLEESEPHTHTDECVGENSVLVCGLEESEGHAHSAECCTEEYVCGLEESEDHTHGPECRVVTYVCGLEESEGHSHSSGCYAKEYICGLEESEGHTHTEACYSEGYVCGYEEHVHSPLCYSDRDADLETSSVWEATLPGLTGDPAADLVAVARSQIGYTESQQNYVVSDDGSTQRGYTRYGEWYGNPYGSWSAMFVSFCLNYAQHPAYQGLANSGAETMRLAADSLGYCRDAGYLPNPGDLVFLDRDGNGAADGVAVVTGWNEESFNAVEGDYGNAVQELSYAVDSSVILAYARLTESDSASFMLLDDGEDDIALTSETEETITVTYVIDNEAYTSDTGNGKTHITVSSTDGLATDGGLSYKSWAGRYQVTGTGTLISYEIPAGTSVSGSGFSAPKVNVENIDSALCAKTYIASYNWVTDSGMLCTDGMVFSSDTTLYLCLYGTEESYSLNWVCNCDNGGTHSVTYYVSVANAVFVPGQSLSAAYIPSAEQVNSNYINTEYGCTAGPDHGMALQGWYLMKADGTEVPLEVGTPLLEDYADPNATRTIKVYARWTEAEAEQVTATFVNGDTTVDAVTLASGTALGENLPAAPTAPEGKIFVGWQADGAADYATAETVITANTTFRAVFADKVTATFKNGDTEVETRELAAGSVLGELPEGPEAPEDQSFLGWQAEGTTDYVTAETVINANTTYIAVFGELNLCQVYFHDILPNGEEGGVGDEGVASISWGIPMGDSVQEWLMGDILEDGTQISDCIWYTDQNKTTRFDLATAVTNDELHLYTFSYSITLRQTADQAEQASTFSLQARTVEVEVGNDGTLTLILREGEKPTAADFVVDGVDYSLYTWTYTDSNNTTQTLNISSLIANGATGNITATSSTSDLAISPSETTTKNIRFFVFLDDGRVLVETRTVTAYRFSDTGNRWYIPAATLESVYAQYGFKAEQLQDGTHYFPHVDSDGGTIWGDTAVKGITINSQTLYFSPIINNNNAGCDVYYLPAQTITGSSAWNDQDLIAENTFYTVTISDPLNWVYSSADNIPPVSYVFTGGDATVTVPMPEDESTVWQANGEALTGGVENADGTITYTIEGVTEPIVIAPHRQGSYVVTYDIHLTSTPVGTAPTINGESTYVDVFDSTTGESYVVLTPSKTEYTRNGDNSLVTLTFAGWDTDGDMTTAELQAGQTLTMEQLAALGGKTLTAIWTDRGYTGSVSFYINLNLEVRDYDGSSNSTNNNYYTGAVYGTEVTIDPSTDSYPAANVLEAADQTQTAAIDAQIRTLASGVIATYNSEERTFTLTSFPDDESVLAKVREYQAGYIASFVNSDYYNSDDPYNVTNYLAQTNENGIPLYRIINDNNQYIPVEELTSENYTVRWYVFKYDGTNGWHVDGVLVKKQGQLTVTKTFYGNSTAISEVKKSYTISVNDGSSDIYILNLDEKSDTNTTGYTAYDSATDTYTWTIPLTAGRQFTLKENNYRVADTIVPGVTMASVPEYMVTNTDSQSTVSRTAYLDSGVTVTAKAYSVDLNYTNYQTVKFYNSYLPTNVMMLSKVDDYGNPLPGVQFQLKFGNQVSNLFKNRDGYYYIYNEAETEAVADNCITTDSQGNAIIVGLKDERFAGQYTLTEVTPPAGYTAISDIEFNADSSGNITLTEHPNAKLVGGGLVIRVKNTSETISVTAVKEWSDSTNKPVKVTLCLDGTPMAGYEQELNADNNWTCTWDNLPAYVGGSLGNYTLRETWIGDTAYSATVDDGYEDYLVTYANPSYTYDTDGKPTALILKVTNRTYSGGVEFTKVNENNVALAGATFQLYSDPECTTPYGSAVTSDASGRVSFGSLAAGFYYMKETQVPDNYKSNATIYQIRVTGSGTTIKVYDPENKETVGDALTTIRNEPATASLLVQKVDESGEALTGAKFELYKDGKKVTIGGKTAFDVDANGQLTFQDLTPGSYTLRETGAPAGYYRLAEDIPFTVSEGRITCEDNSGKWSFSSENNTFTITVTNVAGSELPHTGGMGTLYGTMVGLLMMAGSLYAILMRRKRERGAV